MSEVAYSFWDSHAPVDLEFLATNFPCRRACPVGTNAGGYVALIAQGRFAEAYALARGPNPFASVCGRICAHPCEAACRRGAVDAPLQIRALKRVVNERHGVEAASFDRILASVERPRPRTEKPGRVAIVGAGPAGLACGHDLALMGHEVVIFDAAPVAGGMMRLGIPEYRLPRGVLDREIEFIKWLGVELRLGVEIGGAITFADLCRDYDAVFLAPGCRKGRSLRIPGADAPGVLTAVDFLLHVNLGHPLEVGRRVLVVGGGNVAFDAARSARRFGGTSAPDEEHHNLAMDTTTLAARALEREVTLMSLEARHELPADQREWEEGLEEGVSLLHRRAPQEILRDASGRARGVRTLDVARVFDEQGRFAPQTVPGSEREIACDTVILAIGQMADLSFLGPDHGLSLTPQGLVAVDRETLGTSRAGVFAGGDLAFGPRIVITAVADGRRAAKSIDTHLTGRRDAPIEHRIQIFPSLGYDHPFAVGDYDQIERAALPVVEVEARTQRREVERVLDLAAAQAEGKRCLHCWINTVFDGSRLEGSECIQCGGCVDVCPEQCLDLASIVKIAGKQGPGAALLKDETRCIRCGLCARRCPVGCISMQATYRATEAPLMRLAEVSL